MEHIKGFICTIVGALGSGICYLLGGWDMGLQTLVICMALDYFTGILVALNCKSPKTDNGALSSKIGFKGLSKKCMILVFVLLASRLDMQIGTDFARNGVIIGFISNEGLSIIENGGLLGINVPVLNKVIELLKKKGEGENNG